MDALYRDLIGVGENLGRIRGILFTSEIEESILLSLLRRSLPSRVLEAAAGLPLTLEHPRLAAAIVLNPRSPRGISLKLLSILFWRDLAEVARSLRVPGPVRLRAEALLAEKVPEMKVGERIALGRIATAPLLDLLFQDPDPRVLVVCLQNPRLKEPDLLRAIRRDTAPVRLLEETARSIHWGENYAARLALLLQPRTPLPIALSFLTSLVKADRERVVETAGLAPLLRIAAERLGSAREGTPSGRAD